MVAVLNMDFGQVWNSWSERGVNYYKYFVIMGIDKVPEVHLLVFPLCILIVKQMQNDQ